MTSYEKFSHNLTLETQIDWEISAFCYYRWMQQNAKKWLNFQNFQLKWKIVKHFARPKQRAALRKLFSLLPTQPPPDEILLRLWNKNFITEIYRNIQVFTFKIVQECGFWASKNGAVQVLFLIPNRDMFAGKFVKSERVLEVFREHIIFNVKWVEIPKMSEVFWTKPYCKMSDLFC